MASIRERPRSDGSTAYRVMFRIDGALVGETLETLEAAEDFARLVERIGGRAARAVRDARDRGETSVLVQDWVKEHIDRLTGVTDGTRKDYRSLLANHITPALGAYPLSALTRRPLETWVNGMTGELSGKTIRNVHSLLSAALTRAVYEGLIPANVAKGVRLPKPDHKRREMTVLSENELAALLAAVPAHYQPLVATMAGTGMRFGEITAMTVGAADLDADPPQLRVTQAWKHTGLSARELGAPKTTKGRRTIWISRQLAAEIRPLTTRKADAYLFTTPRGAVIDHAHFYERIWCPARDKIGRPGLKIHDLRHTYATRLAAKIPLDQLQRLLGHESIQTTVDVYGHARPGDAAAAARAVEEMLAGALPALEDAAQGPVQPLNELGSGQPGLDDQQEPPPPSH